MTKITIVGAGMMGSALTVPASDRNHNVRLVGTPLDRKIIASLQKNSWHPTLRRNLPETVRLYQIEELQNALDGADLIIGGVSSFGIDWFADNVLPVVPANTPVLMVTKGLIGDGEGNLATFPEYLRARYKGNNELLPISAIGGPCTSYELVDRRHSSVCFTGDDPVLLEKMREMLKTPYYHISISTDVTGVEVAVALKNAYALAVTLAIGLNEQECGIGVREAYNPQAAIFEQAVREMGAAVRLLGGKDESIPFGIADLYVTIFGGRTRLLGVLLGRGNSFTDAMEELEGITLESVVIARRIAKELRQRYGEKARKRFPLMFAIDDVISGGQEVTIPWETFAKTNQQNL